MEHLRLIIYPKDVVQITGRSESYSRKLIASIKKKLGREKFQYVTFDEFYEYIGIKKQELPPV